MRIKKVPAERVPQYVADEGWLVPYSMPSRPTMPVPDMPFSLGEITGDEMMELFRLFTAWANYLSVEVANLDSDEEELEQNLNSLEAGYIIDGGGINVARAKRDVAEDVRQMRFDLRVAKHKRKLVEALFKNCERSAAALSRELTRRTEMMKLDRRSTT